MSYQYLFYGSSEARALKSLQVQMSNNLQLIRFGRSRDIPKIKQMLIKYISMFWNLYLLGISMLLRWMQRSKVRSIQGLIKLKSKKTH